MGKFVKHIPIKMEYGTMPNEEHLSLEDAVGHFMNNPEYREKYRLGQWFLKTFLNLPKPWPELYYETNFENAWLMLKDWEQNR